MRHKEESSRYGLWGRIEDESGQTLAFWAIFMAFVAIGFLAIGIDMANLFYVKRTAQSAADAAAVAAAQQAKAGNSSAAELSAAQQAAALNNFNYAATSNAASVVLNSPPSQGIYASGTNATHYVEAIVSKPVSTFIMKALGSAYSQITVSARAVASTGVASPTCVCLDGGSGDVLNMSNDAKLVATGCNVTDDSTAATSATVVGSASITASALNLVSTSWTGSNVNNSGTLNGTSVATGAAACSKTLPAAPTYSGCVADPTGGAWGTFTVGPASSSGTVCYNSLAVGSNGATVTLNPGIYVINGGALHFESGSGGHSNLGGNGVFFYLVNGASFTIDNGATVNLTAMGSGTYEGILIYQDAADSNTLNFQGGSSSVFTGAIIAPDANVTSANGSAMTITGEVDAQSLTLAGGTTVDATPLAGGGAAGSNVGLVE
jgi:hypothetical protein